MIPDTVAPSAGAHQDGGRQSLLPLVLLAAVLFAIVRFGPSELLRDPEAPPVEILSVQRALLKSEGIVAHGAQREPGSGDDRAGRRG